jgi:hypothetical protein
MQQLRSIININNNINDINIDMLKGIYYPGITITNNFEGSGKKMSNYLGWPRV